jgi:cationic peptide transport system substrate-binding protein
MTVKLKLRNTIRQKREQLKALGAENLTLQLWVPTSSQAWNPSPLKTAELLQADMAQVGVKVVIVPVEGRFQARLMDMNHDLTLTGWAPTVMTRTASSVRC